MGYTMQVGPEAEFFLFRLDAEGNPTVDPHDAATYFDVAPMDKGEDCRRDIELTLQQMDFHLEAAHHEVAIGQHEIDFRHGDALSTADNLITFRMVVKVIAAQHGMHVTFMAKPLHGENGSGMHVNQSLSRGDENAFLDESDDLKLSTDAYSYIAGILKHLPAITAVANPTVNSYKRLLPGYEAPVYIAGRPAIGRLRSVCRPSADARRGSSCVRRTPRPTRTRVWPCMLQAGLDGITKGLTPPEPVNRNIYDRAQAESAELGISSLPHDLPGQRARAGRGDAPGAGLVHLQRVPGAEASRVGLLQRAGAPLGDRPVHGSLLIETRPAGSGDAEAVLEVILARDLADVGEPDFTLDDLRDEWADPEVDLARDSLVVEAGTGLAEGARRPRRTPRTCTSIPGTAATASGCHCCRWWRRGRWSGACSVASTSPTATPRRPACCRPTATSSTHRYWRMVCDLDRDPEAARYPEGVILRRFRLGVDDREVHALVQAAFSEIEGNIAYEFDPWRVRSIESSSFSRRGGSSPRPRAGSWACRCQRCGSQTALAGLGSWPWRGNGAAVGWDWCCS